MTIEERFEFLTQSIESHDRQLGEITDRIADLTLKHDQLATKVDLIGGHVDKMLIAMSTLTIAVNTLADVANNHERRLTRIEGNTH